MPSTISDVQVPRVLPVLPGAAIDARYVMSGVEPRNKADTLDALPLPGDRVALLVADVVGTGLPAAIAVSQVRAVLRERLAAGADLLSVMESAHRYAFDHPEACSTTVCVAVLGLADGTLEWSTAGQTPPFRTTPGAPPELLASTPSRPLGCGGQSTVHRTRLGVGESVGLYTNGLVSVPGQTLARGLARLLTACAAASREPTRSVPGVGDAPCDRILRSALTPDGTDDVALLIATRTVPPAPFSARMAAVPENLPVVRHRINQWLDGLGVGLMDHVGVGHAVVELVANAVAHAYVDSPADPVVEVEATLGGDGVVQIEVSDHGHWLDRGRSGLGLMMASGLVDGLRMDRGPHGTRVTLTQRLTRPVPLLQETVPDRGSVVVEEPDEFESHAEPGLMAAVGPVDEGSVEMFDAALTRATLAGTADAVVDLSGVTHLASAGVQTLFEFVARGKRTGTRVTLRAPGDSPAGQILALVDLEPVP